MLEKTHCLALLLLASTTALCQSADRGTCTLPTSSSEDATTLHGKIADGAHDMLLIVPHCDEAVVLVYAGDSDTKIPFVRLAADENLKRFRKYTEATYGRIGRGICMQCPKYEVEASLTGRLEVATTPDGLRRDNIGFLWDASGKLQGTSGFGHPNRPYKYRLVIESVSDVIAHKRAKPGS